MLGIGHYINTDITKQEKFFVLNGINADYKNMLKLFINHLDYTFIYQTIDNKIAYYNHEMLKKNHNKYNSKFKIQWNCDEIDLYLLKCKKLVDNIKPDSLLCIVTGYGNKDDFIYDSEYNEYKIIRIIDA